MKRTFFLAASVFLLLRPASPARAVTRACMGDPVADTAAVLCAPPSGPCDDATVSVGTKLKLTTACIFDVGGRDLIIDRAIDLRAADPTLAFTNAADVTITDGGKLRARSSDKPFFDGGFVEVESSGGIVIAGLIDVSASFSGDVALLSSADVRVEAGGKIKAHGLGAPLEGGGRVGEAGTMDIEVGDGSVVVDGKLDFRASGIGNPGAIEIFAARGFTLTGRIGIGRGVGAGTLDVDVGDDILIAGRIDGDAGNQGDGAALSFFAGDDTVGDQISGGSVDMRGAIVNARGGGSRDHVGGYGGDVQIGAAGPVTIAADTVIRVDAGVNADGGGGSIDVDTGGLSSDGTIQPTAGNAMVAGILSARGGSRGGEGGIIGLAIGRDLELTADVDVSGSRGGEVFIFAGDDVMLDGGIAAVATDPSETRGRFVVRAGTLAGAMSGLLTVANDIAAHTGREGVSAFDLELRACTLVVEADRTVDARGSTIVLASVAPMQLGAGSRYLAAPTGTVRTVHPPGADPIIGPGVVFDPSRTDDPTAFTLPGCP